MLKGENFASYFGRSIRPLGAIILLIAAALKGYELSQYPSLPGYLEPRWFSIALVIGEWILGWWVLAGITRRLSSVILATGFFVFSGITFFKAVSREPDCGCFGRLHVDPWATFSLDAGFVLCLLVFRRYWWHPSAMRQPGFGTIRVAVAMTGLLLVIPALGKMRSTSLDRDNAALDFSSTGVTILRPAQWVDKRLPILDYTDIKESLGRGEWTVILYHRDCPLCRQVLSSLGARRSQTNRVALIEMPPLAENEPVILNQHQLPLRGHLTPSREWFAETPVLLRMNEGNVVSFSQGKSVLEQPEMSAAWLDP